MYRTVDCRIWRDPWFEELEPLQKLVFFSLLTNSNQTACGVIEITIKTLSFETGIDIPTLKDILDQLNPKVVWWPEYNAIWVRNFYRHQRANSNELFVKGAKKALAAFPQEVRRTVGYAYPELLDREDTKTNPIPIPLVSERVINSNREVTETETLSTRTADAVAPSESDNFENFWNEFKQHYPDREGQRKGIDSSAKEWARKHLGAANWDRVVEAAKRYKQKGELPVDPIRFFKSREYPNGLWREFEHWRPTEGQTNGTQQKTNGATINSGLRAAEAENRIRARDAALAKPGPGSGKPGSTNLSGP